VSEAERDDLALSADESRNGTNDLATAGSSWVDTELHDLRPTMELLDRVGARMGIAGVRQDGSPAESDVAGLLGDFLIVRVIGRGGMGVVYEAVQKSLNRRVALKILPSTSAADPRKVKRFLIEAQAAACLQHPHIVPVHVVGSESGLHYFAMQYIEGRTLAEIIAERRRSEEPPARQGAPTPAQTACAIPSPQRGEGARRAGEGACAHPGESACGDLRSDAGRATLRVPGDFPQSG